MDDIIKVKRESNWIDGFKIKYDGKYITLYGRDRNYPGMKLSDDTEDWYEEMVLVPIVEEIRNVEPEIVKVDEEYIYIDLKTNLKNLAK